MDTPGQAEAIRQASSTPAPGFLGGPVNRADWHAPRNGRAMAWKEAGMAGRDRAAPLVRMITREENSLLSKPLDGRASLSQRYSFTLTDVSDRG